MKQFKLYMVMTALLFSGAMMAENGEMAPGGRLSEAEMDGRLSEATLRID